MTKKSFTLQELARLTQSKLVGDPSHRIFQVADLESAGVEDVSFLNRLSFGQTSRYDQAMRKSQAGAIFVHPDTPLITGKNYLLTEDPTRSFQQVLEVLHGTSTELSGFKDIHPTAVIHPTAKIGNNARIGPYAVIDQDVTVGDRTFIGSHAYIGPGTTIGDETIIHPHVTIREQCRIGNRVILQAGSVIGSCGFGFTTDRQGKHAKLNQVGNVVIEDDVEIGANSTIDRSRFKSTLISSGTKIDNLVQIGHGARIGRDNMIVAQTGIAGSAETGRHVVMGGQCGIAGHLKICDGAIFIAKSGVDKSITEPGRYGGSPVVSLGEHNRSAVHVRNLDKHVKEIKELSARVQKLEKSVHSNA